MNGNGVFIFVGRERIEDTLSQNRHGMAALGLSLGEVTYQYFDTANQGAPMVGPMKNAHAGLQGIDMIPDECGNRSKVGAEGQLIAG